MAASRKSALSARMSIGQRQKAVAGQNRRRLVEGAVHRRLAAPQIVIVHGGQIVMDQRIAVHALDGGGCAHGAVAVGIEERRGSPSPGRVGDVFHR